LNNDIVSLSAEAAGCSDSACSRFELVHVCGAEGCTAQMSHTVIRSNYGKWNSQGDVCSRADAGRVLVVIAFVNSHYYALVSASVAADATALRGLDDDADCDGDSSDDDDADGSSGKTASGGMAGVLRDAVAGLVLSRQIATSSRPDDAGVSLLPSMIRLPGGQTAYVSTLLSKLFTAANELRGIGERGERFKSRLSIVATAATASHVRTVASGNAMTEGSMLEVLSDVAVQVQSDSAGQTWYLGRVMAVQDMPGKSWQNRSHPVDLMLSPEKVRVRCEWYHRSLDGDRLTFYFGDHPTDEKLSAPLDAAWYGGDSILGLVLHDYHKDTDTFSVEVELCADYDTSAAVVTSSAPKTAAERKRAAPTSARRFCCGWRTPDNE
jgi:hypothetical protein